MNYSYCSAASIRAGHKTALSCSQGDLELLSVQKQRTCNAHWNRHVTNDVLTASSYHLRKIISHLKWSPSLLDENVELPFYLT